MKTTDFQLIFEGKPVPVHATLPLLKWMSLHEENLTYALRNIFAASSLVGKGGQGVQVAATAPEAFLDTGRIIIRFKAENALPLLPFVETVIVITSIRIAPDKITTEGNVSATIRLASEYAEEKVFKQVGWVNQLPVLA